MLRAAVAELRAHPGRFLALALAIVLGVGFAAATVVFTGSFDAALGRSVAAQVSRVDVVVTVAEGSPDLTELRATPGVLSVEPAITTETGFTSATSRGRIELTNIPIDPDRRWYTLESGRWPVGSAEMAVAKGIATRNSWELGSVVTLGDAAARQVTVVALLSTSLSASADSVDTGYGTVDLLSSIPGYASTSAYLRTAPGFSTDEVAAAINAAGAESAGGKSAGAGSADAESSGAMTARTAAQVTAEAVRNAGNGTSVINVILLAFVALAGLVAAMVVTTTFTILIAQRRRQIALLRCVGATGDQVRRSILAEVALVAVAGSTAGVAVGIGIGRVACAVAGIDAADFRLPAGRLLLAAGIGMVVTAVAAVAPIARAMRIPPMAALRTDEGVERLQRVGRLRVSSGLLLGLAGAGLLAGGVHRSDLAMATLGGAVTAVGVLILLPVALPRVLTAFSGLGALFGAPGRLGAQNLLRNPARAGATCTALVVGVGAIVTLLVASSSAQAGADRAVGASNVLDLQLSATGGLPAAVTQALSHIDGVAATAQVLGSQVQLDGNDYTAFGPTADQFQQVRNGGELRPGQIAVPGYLLQSGELQPGDPVVVRSGRDEVTLTVAAKPITDDGSLVMLRQDLQRLDPSAGVRSIWAKFVAGAEPNQVLGEVNRVVAPYAAVTVSGSAVSRAATAELLHALVTIALALLGVTVVIAVVGVGNTLGLSVIERTRESALLRALGLRRRQLRSMLAVEAGLLAVVAAVVGTFFGVLFGWAAVGAAFGQAGAPAVLSVPIGPLGLVFVGAVVAGVLASVVPGRHAARATPTQALVDA